VPQLVDHYHRPAVRDQPEPLSAIIRNRCPGSSGISVRDRPDYAPAPIVLVTPTVFSLQFHRRYLKVDAVDVASGGPQIGPPLVHHSGGLNSPSLSQTQVSRVRDGG
jgi:hypothetical protein